MFFLKRVILLFSLISSSTLLASSIGHMGRLVDGSGTPLTGTANLQFEVHYSNDLTSTGLLCTIVMTGVPLNNGIYHANLDFSSLDASGPECNLNNILKNTPATHTVVMRVRETSQNLTFDWQNILHVPAAYRSEVAAMAEEVLDGVITAPKLNDMGAAANQVLTWTGSVWEPRAIPAGNAGTVTSVGAGDGLTAGGTAADPVLNVDVDGTTVEIATNKIQVKDASITTAKLADDAVIPSKMQLNPDHFLQADPLLSLFFDPIGAITSGLGGIRVAVDDNYVEITGNEVTLKNSGVTPGTYTSVIVDAKGRVTSGGAISSAQLPNVETLETACVLDQVLASDGAGGMICTTPSSTATPTGAAGGDLNGTYPNPTIATGAVTFAKTNFADGDIPQAKVNGLTATLASQSSDIAGNTTNIATNTTDISNLQTDVGNNTATIATKQDDLGDGVAGQYLAPDRTWQTLDTSAVPEGLNLYFLESRVRDTILTGYTIGANLAIADSDNLMQAIAKLEAQIQATASAANSGTVTSVTAGDGLNGGTFTTSGTISMPTVGTAASYGSATTVPVLTTDSYGRVTGVVNTTINGLTYDKLVIADAEIPQVKINGLATSLSGKEPSITAGTASQYWSGDKTWQELNTDAVTEGTKLYFTQDRTRNTILTGLDTTAGTVAATDSILEALGKTIGNMGLINQSQWTTSGSDIYFNSSNVGIGTTSPERKLHVLANGSNFNGIFLEDSSLSSASPYIEVRGKRSDGNTFGSFSGQLVLTKNRTDAAISSGSHLGRIIFGGNHTDGSDVNMGYAAGLYGVSEGIFNSSSDMPTGIAIFTGSTSNNPNTSNVNIGTERLRVSAEGNVGIGTSTPTTMLDVAGQIKISGGSPGLGKVLTSDNNGLATWETAPSGADNLGNHTATQNIDLATFKLVGESGTEGINISSTGNVGVKTSSPLYPLQVTGVSHLDQLRVGFPSGTNFLLNYNSTSSLNFGSSWGFNIRDNFNNQDKLFIERESDGGRIVLGGQVKITGGSPGLGKVLTSDATGLTTWEDIPSSADNLGNHTATQNIDLATFKIVGQGGTSGINVNSDGNVKIGTDSASTDRLLVSGNSTIWGKLEANFNGIEDALHVHQEGTGNIASFSQGASWDEKFVINNIGDVGIGTDSPSSRLQLGTSLYFDEGLGNIANGSDIRMSESGLISADNNLLLNIDGTNTGTGDLLIKKGAHTSAGSTLFALKNSGNIGIGTSTPTDSLVIARDPSSNLTPRILLTDTQNLGGIHDTDGSADYGIAISPDLRSTGSGAAYFSAHTGGGTGSAAQIIFRGGHGPLEHGHTREIMVMDTSNGNVGIGTTSPTDILTVGGANGKGITIKGDPAGVRPMLKFDNPDNLNPSVMSAYDGGAFTFEYPEGTKRMEIVENGNVSIGIATPTYKLHVNGQVAGVGAYVNASDERFKENITVLPGALEKLLKLRGVSYTWKENSHQDFKFSDKTELGVIAQEVEKVYPEAVVKDKNGFRSVAYSMLIAPMIESLKTLSFKIDDLFNKTNKNSREIASIKSNSEANLESLIRLENENEQLKNENQQMKNYLCQKDPSAPFCHTDEK